MPARTPASRVASTQNIPHRWVAATLLLAATLVRPVGAQELPTAPDRLTIRSEVAVDGSQQWRIGPLLLRLPDGWSNTSTPVFARLQGPSRSFSTFMSNKVTARARHAGYSLLNDPRGGPSQFATIANWDDCEGNVERVAKPLIKPSGDKIVVYVSCTVQLRPGVPGTLQQVGIYTPTRLMLLHAGGPEKDMKDWLAAVVAHRWQETD
ncbi:hypothetical protein [Mitsuaria sp. 7]|uniref:hypothetical protein n=1 Tax=Mitsuaria sp. 7 TaxID=1658665 RepID=UPI0007DD047B|nr:hypothetical protein [Mitsuaria sp. 7]ANH68017.1 hypothetical protein ABE85_11340 [Mitsuaria sp. 7]